MKIGKRDLKAMVKEHSRYYFSRKTMAFFDSKLETGGYISAMAHVYFVTSEKCNWVPGQARKFSVRKLDKTLGDVRTIGDFQGLFYKWQADELIAKCFKEE